MLFHIISKKTRSSTTGGSNIEHNKYIGQISTTTRTLTSKNSDLLSHFDKIEESQAQVKNASLKHLLLINHKVVVTKGKRKGHLPLDHILGFCRTFNKNTKRLGFHLTFKTADLQDIIYTTLGDAIKLSFDKLLLTFVCANIQSRCSNTDNV